MKKDLAVKEKDDLAISQPSLMGSMPDYIREKDTSVPVRGAENVESGDIIMPLLKICGKQTPQFDVNSDKYIPELKMGDFFNTITREIYGPVVYAVPLLELKSRARFPEYGSGLPIICRSADGKIGIGDPGGECAKCDLKNFGKKPDGKPAAPVCTEFLRFAVLLMPKNAKMREDFTWSENPRLDTVAVLDFKRTSSEAGKKWITLLKMRDRDWFAGAYKLTSTVDGDGKNSWYIPVPDNAGWLQQSGYLLGKECYDSMKSLLDEAQKQGKTIASDVDLDQENEPGSNG